MDKLKQRLENLIDEIKKLDSDSLTNIFTDIYDKYLDFLLTLGPDKIVAVFNIIMDLFILSSFLSLTSILLTENIINRIKFLDNYPRIKKLLKIRSDINRNLIKFYLLADFGSILMVLLANIYMFLL